MLEITDKKPEVQHNTRKCMNAAIHPSPIFSKD